MLDYFWLFSLLCVVFEKEWLFSYVCVSHFSLYQPHSVHANGFHDVWDVLILYKYIYLLFCYLSQLYYFLNYLTLFVYFPDILHLLFHSLFSILGILKYFSQRSHLYGSSFLGSGTYISGMGNGFISSYYHFTSIRSL